MSVKHNETCACKPYTNTTLLFTPKIQNLYALFNKANMHTVGLSQTLTNRSQLTGQNPYDLTRRSGVQIAAPVYSVWGLNPHVFVRGSLPQTLGVSLY